jgi:hypothetical protein
LPASLVARVGPASLTIGPGPGIAATALARPADPVALVPERVSGVLLWDGAANPTARADLDQVAAGLSRAIPTAIGLSRIRLHNPGGLGIMSMVELLGLDRLNLPGVRHVTGASNLLVLVDPSQPLPLLLARQWADTRVILVLTAPPLPGIDTGLAAAILATEPAAAALADRAVPFRAALTALEDVGVEVANYAASLPRPGREYYFALPPGPAGRPVPGRPGAADLIIRSSTAAPSAELLSGQATYADRIAELLRGASLVALRSGLVYPYETWIREAATGAIVRDLLAKGARIDLAAPDETDGEAP